MGGINKYLFDPEGDPKPEGWIGLLLIACGLAYAINQMTSKPMEEIVYMDFLNKYLMPGHVKEINLTKDRRTEVFNFRAEIEMTDGKKFYMILGSQESFLAKLDMVQRQMGKHPNQFIPVKYVNESETTGSQMIFNLAMAAITVGAFYSLYKRGRTNHLKPGQKKGVTKKDNSSN
jgi:ATP-dependent Zn protease